MPGISVSCPAKILFEMSDKGISPSKAFQIGVQVCMQGGIESVTQFQMFRQKKEQMEKEMMDLRLTLEKSQNQHKIAMKLLHEKTERLKELEEIGKPDYDGDEKKIDVDEPDMEKYE